MNTAAILKRTKFSSTRDGDLNRFYTRGVVGDLITSLLATLNPRKVLDLGAGDGLLSASAAQSWQNAEFVTVDVDQDCITNLHANIVNAGAVRHIHYVHDVLDPNLPRALSQHQFFDLAVCNPPFFKPEWRRGFAQILQHADFSDACQSVADVSAEALFLAQNLRLVREGGVIAMIAPDGMMTGWRTKTLRKALISKHRIDCVLQLPGHSFHDTEARCFVLMLTKGVHPANTVKLLRYDVASGLSEPLFVDVDEAEQRLDYDYHASKTSYHDDILTLRQLGADVKRGSIGMVEAKATNFPVFHTTDFSASNSGRVSLTANIPSIRKRLIVAQAGDIIMARVDRRLHEKVVMVVSGMAALSDCVYRVRLPNDVQNLAFQALHSAEGAARIRAVSKGVSARLLGKADLLDMPLNINKLSITAKKPL